LEVAEMSDSFFVGDAWLERAMGRHLAAARERGIQLGIAVERIDGLMRDLRAAKDGGYEWATSAFVLELALRKPAVG
jgi:hypothetical protein